MVTCRMTDECNGDCLVVVVLANTKVGANNQLGPTARIRILQKRPARCCPPPPATAVWVGPYQMRNVARGLGGADVGRVLVHRRYLVHSVLSRSGQYAWYGSSVVRWNVSSKGIPRRITPGWSIRTYDGDHCATTVAGNIDKQQQQHTVAARAKEGRRRGDKESDGEDTMVCLPLRSV